MRRERFYTPRERAVLNAADRVVIYVLVGQGEWIAEQFYPPRNKSLADFLTFVQRAMKSLERVAGYRRKRVYLGGIINGELHVVAVPHEEE